MYASLLFNCIIQGGIDCQSRMVLETNVLNSFKLTLLDNSPFLTNRSNTIIVVISYIVTLTADTANGATKEQTSARIHYIIFFLNFPIIRVATLHIKVYPP